ncbi:MAG: hypothetical protein ABI890_06745 [Lapillicoccus sp.]
MDTFTDLTLVVAFVTALVTLLERTHRRSLTRVDGLSRPPLGRGADSDRDLVRTLQEIEAVRERDGVATSPRDDHRSA